MKIISKNNFRFLHSTLHSQFLILNSEQGQSLITLLFLMVISLIIFSAVIIIAFTNNLSASTAQQGDLAYVIAENGIENALLQLLRNPSYTGETVPSNGGNAA